MSGLDATYPVHVQLLKFIHGMGCATTKDIMEAFPPRGKYPRQYFTMNIWTLQKKGWIDSVDPGRDNLDLPDQWHIHFCTEEGARKIGKAGGVKRATRVLAEHDYAASRFLFAIRDVVEDSIAYDSAIEHTFSFNGERHNFKPDKFFTVPSGDHTNAFFLEWERSLNDGTHNGDPHPRRVMKLLRALYYSKSGEFERRYEYLGLSDFYLLMVLPTYEKTYNLLTACEESKKDGLCNRKFWFTDRASLERDPKGRIWQTPKDFRDGVKHSILD
jgi:hypothetical protein